MVASGIELVEIAEVEGILERAPVGAVPPFLAAELAYARERSIPRAASRRDSRPNARPPPPSARHGGHGH